MRQHFPASVIRLPQRAVNGDVDDESITLVDGYYELYTDDVTAALGRLESLGFSLGDCRISAPTLEDLFLKLTGHALRN